MPISLSLIAAVAENGCIGRNGGLPWRLPGELAYFKQMTMGKPVLMGRATFESIGSKPLPHRPNIVVSASLSPADYPDVIVCPTVEAGLAEAEKLARRCEDDEIMVIGGSRLYQALLPKANRFYLTEVHAEVQGDTYFPDIDRAEWREIRRDRRPAADTGGAHDYSLVLLERHS